VRVPVPGVLVLMVVFAGVVVAGAFRGSEREAAVPVRPVLVMGVGPETVPVLPRVVHTDEGTPGQRRTVGSRAVANDVAKQLVDSINATYGVHPGFRAAHAKGVLCSATFTPTPAAARLSRAAHLAGAEVRAHVRFSNGSGDPTTPDTTRDARGMAVKFYLPDSTTTDVVAISVPAFFARTPEDLLAFNQARRVDPATGQPDIAKVGEYLAEHPEAMTAVGAAMAHPIPASYAALTYHALHAFGFVAADDSVRFGRYHLIPEAGDEVLSDEEVAARGPDFLATELADRLARGPAQFLVHVQLAGAADSVDDPTAVWPDDREVVELGRLKLTGLATDRERDGDILVFDPTRVPDGIVLSDDAILRARSGAYGVSVARRTAS
jgi:catalase